MEVEKSCGEVTVTLTNTWVLGEAELLQPIALDGQNAGLDNDYLKPDDERVIAHTEIIGGGETASVTFSVEALEAGGSYTFFCSFPGHWAVMQGDLIVS